MQGATPCEYSDRDRYHAERGVSLSDNFTTSTPTPQPSLMIDPLLEPSKPKRRRLSSSATSSDGPRPQSPSDSRNGGYNSILQTPSSYESNTMVDEIGGGGVTSQNLSGTSPSSIVNGPPAGPLKRILVPFFR